MLANRQKGFTLIELMVSVALMLILVGAVVMIFSHSTTVFTTSETKMKIYQNARAVLELMAREIGSIPKEPEHNLIITNPQKNLASQRIMLFDADTFWIDGTERKRGTTQVEYYLKRSTDNTNLWRLIRKVKGVESVIARYINVRYNADGTINTGQPDLTIGFFTYDGDDGTNKTSYTDDNDSTEGWKYTETDSGTNHEFDGATNSASENLLARQVPPAIRITMSITDRHRKATRTVTRTIWIATAAH